MMEDITAELIAQVGFPIAVTLYLLFERAKFNMKLVETLERISTVIEERLPKVKNNEIQR